MIGRQHQDHPFDLAPLAEMREIADIAAAFGPRRGLQPRIIAKGAHQRLRIVEGGPVGDIKLGVNRRSPWLFPTYQGPCQSPGGRPNHANLPDTMFNIPFTKSRSGIIVPDRDGLVSHAGQWQRACMSQTPSPRAPRATGSILALTIIAGAVIGAINSQPSAGLLAGAAIGSAISLAFWWYDRRA